MEQEGTFKIDKDILKEGEIGGHLQEDPHIIEKELGLAIESLETLE